MSYHVDRFFTAVSVLAGHGHIKQRLIKAFEESLADISADELPVSMKQTFADLKHQMHQVTPLNGEGPVRASVRKMSAADATDCAVSIVALYGELSRLGDGGQVTLPFDGGEKPVPPFLVKSN
jgi:hypothetical protein